LARLLAEVRAIRQQLTLRERSVEDTLAGAMTTKTLDVEGLGRIEKRRGTDRKAWDWDQLLPRLIRGELNPEGTGELPADPLAAVDAMRRLIVDVIGVTPSKGPKIGGLRARDLDPDEWCESTPGRTTVQIPGA